jgi:hypothetical protein
MINFSKYPAPHTRIGYDKVGRAWFVKYLSSLKTLSKDLDASKGKLKSARSSLFTKLYVTCDLYMDYSVGCSVHFFNVRVSGQDYRVVLGYDDKIVRIEFLDARAAEARTREQAAYWAAQNQPAAPAPAAAADDDDGGFYNEDSDDDGKYNTVLTAAAAASNPYGQRIPANDEHIYNKSPM